MASKPLIASDARAALLTAAGLVLLALAIDDGTVGLLAGIIAFVLVVYAMTKIPLRYSLMGLTFFAVVLPNPGEGQPTSWAPPFTVVGQAMLNHLNQLDRGGLLGLIPVSATELFFLILYLILLHRRSTRSKIDGQVIPTPRPLIQLSYVSLATAGFTWVHGLLRGGDFGMSLWQLNTVFYLPVVFLLLQASFRGPQDYIPLTRVFLAAGVYKSFLAYYVVENITVPPDAQTGSTRPAYGTSHHDSMLFSLCFIIVLVPLLEVADRKAKRLAAMMIPILTLGIVSNNRRLAWVQIAIVLFMVYMVSRETSVKRFIRRALLASLPLVLVYIAAGWNSTGGSLFKPVRMMRSVVDAETDSSSLWREMENFDIVTTFRDNPLIGTGYGHPYYEVIPLPAVDYILEPFIPHNSLLGLWGYTGIVGFAGITMLWVVGVYFAMRAYHGARDPAHRAAAIVSFGSVPIYLTQSWGDLGLGTWTGMFMMGSALTIAGKLAVATGQWQGGSLWGKGDARL